MTEHQLTPVAAAVQDLGIAGIEAAHAVLSASGSDIWLHCAASAWMQKGYADEGSEFAEEGTVAHDILSLKLDLYFGFIDQLRFDDAVAKLRAHQLYKSEMEPYTDDCKNYCIERYNRAKAIDPNAQVFIEVRLDFSRWVPRGFGRGDFGIAYNGGVEIIDFKYGKGVFVEVQKNSQMRLYAAGAMVRFEFLFEMPSVRYAVHQPRMGNVDHEETTREELLGWMNNVVQPAARKAWRIYTGEQPVTDADFNPGDHCGWCRAKRNCKARKDRAMKDAQIMQAKPNPYELSAEDLADLYPRMDALISWAKEVKEHALELATAGTKVPGHKVVEGRSNRYISNTLMAVEVLTQNGVPAQALYKPPELLPLGDLETLVGKKRLATLLADYLKKPKGKPTLVPEQDPRPEWSTADDAVNVFAQFLNK